MKKYNSKGYKGRYKRLANEYNALEELCERSSKISYVPVKQKKGFPPDSVDLIYHVKSYVGIDDNRMPIEGYEHKVRITFPANYPGVAGKPEVMAITNIWHPNIRWYNSPKGRVCVNDKVLGAWHSLDQLAEFIGEIIQYKNYLAEERDPYPEDMEVARWVRDFGEPHGLFGKNNPVDPSPLLDPIDGAEPPEVQKVTAPLPPTPPATFPAAPPMPSKKISIKIRPKGSQTQESNTPTNLPNQEGNKTVTTSSGNKIKISIKPKNQ